MNKTLQQSLISAFSRHPHPVWLVGGPIRDALLQAPCKDWDFVCRGARTLAQRAARKLSAKFIVLDDQNRIYRVVLPDRETLDFAELQGKTIQDDLSRRDFSVNAMARLFPNGDIVDPYGGKKDLHKKRIRGISEKAFSDDPLRTLRAFRFAAQLEATIEARTLAWVKKYRTKLEHVSAERVREELLRLWKQPVSSVALRAMDQSGLLSVIFPEIEACRRTAIRYYGKGGVLKHSFESVENLEWLLTRPKRAETQAYLESLLGGYPRAAWLKWAVFLHDFGKPATAKVIKGRLRFFAHEHVGADLALRIGKRMRLSRQETQLLALWVRNHMRTGNLAAAPRITDKALSRYFRDLGEEGIGMVLVSLADHYTYLSRAQWGKGKDPVEKISQKLLQSYFDDRAKILPARVIDGHFLMKHLRLKPGPIIGKLLDAVQDAQAEGKVKTKEEALAVARRLIRS